MTEQEKINSEVQVKLALQDANFATFLNELQQQREDMRRLNERHYAEMQAINARIDSKFDSIMSRIHNLTIAVLVDSGASAVVIAIAGLVLSGMK